MHKVSQDHIELFFCSIRSGLGQNKNPTDRQLRAIYKKLLIHCEIKESGIGNCIPLDEISILKTIPKQIEKTINETSAWIRNLMDEMI